MGDGIAKGQEQRMSTWFLSFVLRKVSFQRHRKMGTSSNANALHEANATLDAVGHAVKGLTHRRIIVACNENGTVAKWECSSKLENISVRLRVWVTRERKPRSQWSGDQFCCTAHFIHRIRLGTSNWLSASRSPRKAARLVIRQYCTFLNLQIGR